MACFMFVCNEAECLMSLQPLLTWPDWFVPSQMWEPHNVKGDVMAAITAISILRKVWCNHKTQCTVQSTPFVQ